MKTFLLDTNVLLHDPSCLKAFGNNKVVLPISILDELDRHKTRSDDVGRNARAVARVLDSLRQEGSLSDGVKFGDSIVQVELGYMDSVPGGLDPTKVDNKFISVALGLKALGQDVVAVTKDINLRVKCDSVQLKAEDYNNSRVTDQPETMYTGVVTKYIDPEVINSLYKVKKNIIEEVSGLPNQYFIFKSVANESQSVIARCLGGNEFQVRKGPDQVWGIHPRSIEQKIAFDMLLDPNIHLVTLIGKAGSGKTLMACAAALQQVMEDGASYNRVLISRPVQPMGKDIGFLPGSIEDKLLPWMQPIYDNLEFLSGSDFDMIGNLKAEGILSVEPLTYIRGRTLPKSIMIVDEVQNLGPSEIKTIITRMGEGSKIILTGDIEQIDNPHVDFSDNGLSYIIEKFKEYDIAGHITLRKGERSKLATLASEIL